MRRKIDFALVFCVRVPTGGRNSAQESRSEEADSSAESGARAGVFAEETGFLSQMTEALWVEK